MKEIFHEPILWLREERTLSYQNCQDLLPFAQILRLSRHKLSVAPPQVYRNDDLPRKWLFFSFLQTFEKAFAHVNSQLDYPPFLQERECFYFYSNLSCRKSPFHRNEYRPFFVYHNPHNTLHKERDRRMQACIVKVYIWMNVNSKVFLDQKKVSQPLKFYIENQEVDQQIPYSFPIQQPYGPSPLEIQMQYRPTKPHLFRAIYIPSAIDFRSRRSQNMPIRHTWGGGRVAAHLPICWKHCHADRVLRTPYCPVRKVRAERECDRQYGDTTFQRHFWV